MQDLNADTIRTDIPTSATVTNVLVWNVEQSGTDDFTVAYEVDQQVKEVMGSTEEIASSLADIFNGMVYDSTFLLIIMSAILALILGQEFSKRTINLEVSAGHSRKQIFTSKIISYLIAFNLMALVYPVSGCIRNLDALVLQTWECFLQYYKSNHLFLSA